MTSSFFLKLLCCALAVLGCGCVAEAQAEELPSAPAPTSLILPKPTLQPSPHEDRTGEADPLCFSPSEDGAFARASLSPETAHALEEYFWEIRKSIYYEWLPNQPRLALRPLLKKGIAE